MLPSGLDCHWIVHEPAPPAGVALSVIFAPVQTVGVVVAIDTEGSETMVTATAFEVTGVQPVPLDETITR